MGYPKPVRGKAGGAPGASHSGRRFVEWLIGELERSPVSCKRDWNLSPSSGQHSDGTDGFLRVHMNGTHKPPRVVCSDRHQRQVERSVFLSDVDERGVKRRISGKQHGTVFGGKYPTALEGPVSIEQTSSRKVLCRNAGHAKVSNVRRFIPAQFLDVDPSARADEGTDAEWHSPCGGWKSCGQLLDGLRVEMIVTIV